MRSANRNTEIFVRHVTGESFATLGAAYGISRARAAKITNTVARNLALGLPPTLPAGSGAWSVVKSAERLRRAAE